MIESVYIDYWRNDNTSNELAEFIYKISPKTLSFQDLKSTFENIEAHVFLNCPNINAGDNFIDCPYL